ncbi:glycosyltransferase [Saccharibacillus sacchari]|uniref:glycosyltransferase n=1 Tax=Saccharibacillus sacchari TaxID=456493 RepID=UPI0014721BB9|nr:glycosyltransferase [Saccharibacillus sacchari]
MIPLVSVVVPVFNVERFLRRCLDSLIHQTLKRIEIIVVNDGSTDGSREIMDSYAKSDSRVIIIDQKNQGLSAARNTALNAAKGLYVAFVDSDDWIEINALAAMYEEAAREEADICACDYALAYEDRIEHDVLGLGTERIVIEQYGLDRLWNSKKYAVMVWNKLYRRSLIEAHGLRFESNSKVFSEDVLFNLCFLRHANVFVSVKHTLYYYLQRPDSLTSTRKPDYMKRELHLVEKFEEWYADYDDRNVYARILNRLFFERVQNSCVHDADYGVALFESIKDLKFAATYHGFSERMDAIARDSETWRPMRVFAFLCAKKRYMAAVLWLRALCTASGKLRFLKKAKSLKAFGAAGPSLLSVETESGARSLTISAKKDDI